MPNRIAIDETAKQAKEELGNLIAKCRGNNLSQAQLAYKVGLSRSNMKYIEDGVNAPTANIYERLIQTLSPDKKTQIEMDRLYMAIRKAPPPDVCRIIINNENLKEAIRQLNEGDFTKDQIQEICNLIKSFRENIK